MKVGIAGAGKMGAAIAERLVGKGHEITVWNRTPDKAIALKSFGVAVAGTPAELAASSEVVISILTDGAAVDATYGGPNGLLSGTITGKLFIEMSTVRPETQQAVAGAATAKGAQIIDCPVGGTVGPAKEGTLLGFAGGPADAVARARPLLEQLCRRVEHVGPSGAGASVKLAINLPLLVYWQALGEAVSLCGHLGIEPGRLIDIIADTSGAPATLKRRGPSVASALKGADITPVTVSIDTLRKDLATMIEEAAALGTTLPVTARVLECFDQASREGRGELDAVTLPAHWALTHSKRA